LTSCDYSILDVVYESLASGRNESSFAKGERNGRGSSARARAILGNRRTEDDAAVIATDLCFFPRCAREELRVKSERTTFPILRKKSVSVTLYECSSAKENHVPQTTLPIDYQADSRYLVQSNVYNDSGFGSKIVEFWSRFVDSGEQGMLFGVLSFPIRLHHDRVHVCQNSSPAKEALSGRRPTSKIP
jgi:hypothetical protein